MEKSRINATSVIMHPLKQAIWGHIWKDTMGKNRPSWQLSQNIWHPIVHLNSLLLAVTGRQTIQRGARHVIASIIENKVDHTNSDYLNLYKIPTYHLSFWWRWLWWVGQNTKSLFEILSIGIYSAHQNTDWPWQASSSHNQSSLSNEKWKGK